MPNPYYITTPIYYVNDRPHIGHCYTTIVADAAARFQRLIRGAKPGEAREVFLLTGTDEHADKVVTSATEHGVSPQAWADRNAAEFRKAFDFCNCSYDDFIRTTEPRHKDKVVGYIKALMASGDIYKGEYTGWYDAGQEEYVTETAAKDSGFKSPINGKPLIKRTEPCYFFRLSKYQAPLLAHIEASPRFVQPDSRRSEVLGRLRGGLNDVPVSRPVTDDPATQWGIRIPGDDANRIYVWIDALFNYLSTVDTPERKHLWPAAVHLIGKDILWFHAVIWPALLMALGKDLPGTIFGHGWWISEGQKMSKSLGNFIDLEKLKAYAGRYSLDALRWYLVTQGPLSGGDADFSHAKFVEVYNADLANGIGNSTSRVANMIEKYFGGKVPDPKGKFTFSASELGYDPQGPVPGVPRAVGHVLTQAHWAEQIREHINEAISDLNGFDLAEAVLVGGQIVTRVDGFINATAPFKLAKQIESNPALADRLAAILFQCAEALRIASLLLSPAMPEKMADLWRRWNCAPPPGVPLSELATFAHPVYGLKPGTPIEKGDALFMRADSAEPPPAS
jgi:methionyl-tRNA synthetase